MLAHTLLLLLSPWFSERQLMPIYMEQSCPLASFIRQYAGHTSMVLQSMSLMILALMQPFSPMKRLKPMGWW
jgi:hypothetical protein